MKSRIMDPYRSHISALSIFQAQSFFLLTQEFYSFSRCPIQRSSQKNQLIFFLLQFETWGHYLINIWFINPSSYNHHPPINREISAMWHLAYLAWSTRGILNLILIWNGEHEVLIFSGRLKLRRLLRRNRWR